MDQEKIEAAKAARDAATNLAEKISDLSRLGLGVEFDFVKVYMIGHYDGYELGKFRVYEPERNLKL